jgi:hypothetical protein
VLQEAGVDVSWDSTNGPFLGRVDHHDQPWFSNPVSYREERSAFEHGIRPGDVIALKGYPAQYCVVTRVCTDNTVEAVDGAQTAVVRTRKRTADVTGYWRPEVTVDLALF